MKIVKSKVENLYEILKIYKHARSYMKSHGNPPQWGDNRPSDDTIKNDIIKGNNYVVISYDNKICITFSFII